MSSHPIVKAALVAAVVVIAVLVLGLFPSIRGTLASHEWSPELGPVPDRAGQSDRSLCGMRGSAESGTVPTAPRADWRYQGTTAYPISRVHGPGRTAPEGYRYCFQHTPEGALFAAANAVVQGSDRRIADEWIEYVLADGTHRSSLLADDTAPSDQSDTRTNIVGFRVLEYSATAARVDIALRLSMPARTVFGSGIFDLVWAEGDWKISTASPEPISVAPIPDLAGYVPWGDT